jgi:hypothetical protein
LAIQVMCFELFYSGKTYSQHFPKIGNKTCIWFSSLNQIAFGFK